MEDELHAFRDAWRRDVAARLHSSAALTKAAASHTDQLSQPHEQPEEQDTDLRKHNEAIFHDRFTWTDGSLRIHANAQQDALSSLLHALAETHHSQVQELKAQNIEEHTVWPEHVGSSITTMYAADPEQPLPVQRMPDEIWHSILWHVLLPRPVMQAWPPMLPENMSFDPPPEPWRRATGADYISIERLGRVCWRLRRLTAHPRLWRAIAQETYIPPLPELDARLACSWRDAFVHEPRVRMNGAYIATCQYIQQGMSEENVWVHVLHVVEFFRYLRFFPNGRCISWLTTERPADVVHRLEPGLRAKGCATGRWQCLSEEGEAPARRGATIVMHDLHDPTLPGYTFQMTLHMRPSPGRWHRLDMLEYASLNLRTGEVLPIPHKHARPFIFSRVLGYGV